MSRAQLPRLAAAILDRAAAPAWREHLAGDLAQEFHRRSLHSHFQARWWFRVQVVWVVIAWARRASASLMAASQADFVSAWRVLGRRPRFACILVGVLATSLGTSATVVAIVDAYLWRPLPYPSADRLVTFAREGPGGVRPPRDQTAVSREGLLAEVADLAVAVDVDGFTIVDGSTPATVLGMWTDAELFTALDIRPALGRTFTAAEVAAGSPVALITHALWTERYGADPSIVGRAVTLRGVERTDVTTPFTIIGVLPPRFWHFDSRIALLTPLKPGTGDVMFFRLRPGLGVEQASARLTELVTAVNRDVDPAWRASLQTIREDHVAPIRELLSAVTLAVGMLLLIAGSNIALLQVMRAFGRAHEMAVRTAIGAGPARILGQVVAENLLLAAASLGLALLIARVLLRQLLPPVELYLGRAVPAPSPAAGLSWALIAAVAAVALVCTVLFGVGASLGARSAGAMLRVHGAETDTPRRARLRHVFSMLQVTATLALLVGAMLAMRTAWHLGRVDLGFDTTDVMTGALVLAPPAFADEPARRGAVTRLLGALESAPEIASAGLITVPAFGIRFPRPVYREGGTEQGAPTAVLIGANAGYFEAARLRLVAGRALSPSESRGLEPVAVISASLAARLFARTNAVGQSVTTTALRPMLAGQEIGPPVRTTYRIVGVTADVRRSLRREAVPEMYVPLAQAALRDLTIQARGRDGVPFAEVSAAVARAVGAVSRDLPLNGAEPLDALIGRQGIRPRFIATLLGIFAGLAAAGAIVGLYAVSAWVAGMRKREAAIRIALGGNAAQVVLALVRGPLLSVAAGLVAGWWASLALGRLMARELSGVAGDDVTTRVIAAAVLACCCALSVYRPARETTRVSPSSLLRD